MSPKTHALHSHIAIRHIPFPRFSAAAATRLRDRHEVRRQSSRHNSKHTRQLAALSMDAPPRLLLGSCLNVLPFVSSYPESGPPSLSSSAVTKVGERLLTCSSTNPTPRSTTKAAITNYLETQPRSLPLTSLFQPSICCPLTSKFEVRSLLHLCTCRGTYNGGLIRSIYTCVLFYLKLITQRACWDFEPTFICVMCRTDEYTGGHTRTEIFTFSRLTGRDTGREWPSLIRPLVERWGRFVSLIA